MAPTLVEQSPREEEEVYFIVETKSYIIKRFKNEKAIIVKKFN